MGIDPGLAMTGSGDRRSLPGRKSLRLGNDTDRTGSSISLRLKTIYDELKSLLEVWKPDLLVLEDVFVLKQYPKRRFSWVRSEASSASRLRTGISVLQVKATEVKVPLQEAVGPRNNRSRG